MTVICAHGIPHYKCNTCKSRARRAKVQELEDFKALLYAYGEEERVRLEHTCRCNGSHVLAYDEDGDPYCETCDKPRLDAPSKGDIDPEVLEVFKAEQRRT